MSQPPNAPSPTDLQDAAPPAPPTTETPATAPAEKKRPVLTALAALLKPAPFGPRWSLFQPIASVCEVPGTPDEIIMELRTEFTIEELLQSALLTRDRDGGLQFAKELRAGAKILVLRDANGNLQDLVDDDGGHVNAEPPALGFALRRATADKQPARMFVTTLAGVQVLHKLRIPATTAAGLAKLTGDQLNRLITAQSAKRGPAYRLTFVGADLEQLSVNMPVGVSKIIEHLSAGCGLYALDRSQLIIEVWRPTTRAFKFISTAIAMVDPAQLRSTIWRSVRKSTIGLADWWDKQQDEVTVSLPRATAELVAALTQAERFPCPETVRRAMVRFQKALTQHTTLRFLADASTARTAQAAMLLYQLSGLSRRLIEIEPLLAKAAVALECRSPRDYAPRQETFEVWTILMGQFQKLLTQLERLQR